MKRNVLIVYYWSDYPGKASFLEYLHSFGRYSPDRVFYANIFLHGLPRFLESFPFDLILFHYSVTAPWDLEAFERRLARLRPLARQRCAKAAFFQDEFFRVHLLQRFIDEMRVDHVFSVAPKTEWPKIYPRLDPHRTRISQVLTGYIDDTTMAKIPRLARETPQRCIDLGYRTSWYFPYWLGRQGICKAEIGERARARGAQLGLRLDISSRIEDTFYGDDWFRFLLRCRYTLGVESGSTLLDADGSIHDRIRGHLQAHPQASFGEVEAACFPGLDGNLGLLAISPRHFEACLTGTAQILMRGGYNGIFRPDRHYLPLDQDYGNLDEVLTRSMDEDQRREMVARTTAEIVMDPRYRYGGFVAEVTRQALAGHPRTDPPSPPAIELAERTWRRAAFYETLDKAILAWYSRGKKIWKSLLEAVRERFHLSP